MTIEQIKMLRQAAQGKFDEFDKQYREAHGNENPPRKFQDATFLYIRSYEGDRGDRDIPPGIVCWLSPDIELRAAGGDGSSIDRLDEGQVYDVEVTVRNDGDLNAYTCTVELYLCDPSLGFSRAAPSTQFLGSQRADVMSGEAARVVFTFTPRVSGHKCMFARVHSIINREIPVEVATLNPVRNRHDAQQNLTIVESAEAIPMMMAPPAGAAGEEMLIEIRALDAKYPPLEKWQSLLGLKFLAASTAQKLAHRFFLFPEGDDFFTDQDRFLKVTPDLVKQLKLGEVELPGKFLLQREHANFWHFPMGKAHFRTWLRMPEVDFSKNRAAAFQVSMSTMKQQPIGGITLIVKSLKS